jgi:hypothetical protein
MDREATRIGSDRTFTFVETLEEYPTGMARDLVDLKGRASERTVGRRRKMVGFLQ